MTTSTATDRGKRAEDKVRKVLVSLKSSKANFDFERMYDARTSRGRIPAQVGDFTYYSGGLHGVIEVKETERVGALPHKNLPVDQLARLKVRELAGGLIVILIYFSSEQVWRMPDFAFFNPPLTSGSYKLDGFPSFATPRNALETVQRDGFYPFW